ncbi:MAG: hypothetical protein ACYCV0_19540, partial [Desulfitobacteriaceae bacterium]
FVGQLMQGRFRSELITTDEYFLTINRYIHLNPVKAAIVEHPLDYRWSSCQDFFIERPNFLIEKEKTLAYFSAPQLERYRIFLEKGISDSYKISEPMWEALLQEDEENSVEESEVQ